MNVPGVRPRRACSDESIPVFERQLGHPAELARVVRDERATVPARGGGDEQVGIADGRSSLLEFNTYAGRVIGGAEVEVEDRDGLHQPCQGVQRTASALPTASKPCSSC